MFEREVVLPDSFAEKKIRADPVVGMNCGCVTALANQSISCWRITIEGIIEE